MVFPSYRPWRTNSGLYDPLREPPTKDQTVFYLHEQARKAKIEPENKLNAHLVWRMTVNKGFFWGGKNVLKSNYSDKSKPL